VEKNKKNCSIRYTSLKQSKHLGTLFKCANEMLLVMETLARRRLDIYQDLRYIICNENKEESQDHLIRCKEQESNWKSVENFAANLAWTALPEETKKRTNKESLEETL